MLLRTAAAAAAAAAVCRHGVLKVSLPEEAYKHYEIRGLAGRVLSSGPVEQGFESTWGQVLSFFPPLPLFGYTKTHIFFVSVIWRFVAF